MERTVIGGKLTNPNYTHLLAVVDRSGSMGVNNVHIEMTNALNEFFADQAKGDGKVLVDYVQFDDTYEVVFSDTPIADAKAVIEPRSMTALLDAIGKSVTDLGTKFAAMSEDERPGQVLVVVVTDGHENSSREFTSEQIKELVKNQTDKWNWNFTFLGANMDAVDVAGGYGFAAGSTMTYNTANVGQTVSALSAYTSRVRSRGSSEFTPEERAAALGNNS